METVKRFIRYSGDVAPVDPPTVLFKPQRALYCVHGPKADSYIVLFATGEGPHTMIQPDRRVQYITRENATHSTLGKTNETSRLKYFSHLLSSYLLYLNVFDQTVASTFRSLVFGKNSCSTHTYVLCSAKKRLTTTARGALFR